MNVTLTLFRRMKHACYSTCCNSREILKSWARFRTAVLWCSSLYRILLLAGERTMGKVWTNVRQLALSSISLYRVRLLPVPDTVLTAVKWRTKCSICYHTHLSRRRVINEVTSVGFEKALSQEADVGSVYIFRAVKFYFYYTVLLCLQWYLESWIFVSSNKKHWRFLESSREHLGTCVQHMMYVSTTLFYKLLWRHDIHCLLHIFKEFVVRYMRKKCKMYISSSANFTLLCHYLNEITTHRMRNTSCLLDAGNYVITQITPNTRK